MNFSKRSKISFLVIALLVVSGAGIALGQNGGALFKKIWADVTGNTAAVKVVYGDNIGRDGIRVTAMNGSGVAVTTSGGGFARFSKPVGGPKLDYISVIVDPAPCSLLPGSTGIVAARFGQTTQFQIQCPLTSTTTATATTTATHTATRTATATATRTASPPVSTTGKINVMVKNVASETYGVNGATVHFKTAAGASAGECVTEAGTQTVPPSPATTSCNSTNFPAGTTYKIWAEKGSKKSPEISSASVLPSPQFVYANLVLSEDTALTPAPVTATPTTTATATSTSTVAAQATSFDLQFNIQSHHLYGTAQVNDGPVRSVSVKVKWDKNGALQPDQGTSNGSGDVTLTSLPLDPTATYSVELSGTGGYDYAGGNFSFKKSDMVLIGSKMKMKPVKSVSLRRPANFNILLKIVDQDDNPIKDVKATLKIRGTSQPNVGTSNDLGDVLGLMSVAADYNKPPATYRLEFSKSGDTGYNYSAGDFSFTNADLTLISPTLMKLEKKITLNKISEELHILGRVSSAAKPYEISTISNSTTAEATRSEGNKLGRYLTADPSTNITPTENINYDLRIGYFKEKFEANADGELTLNISNFDVNPDGTVKYYDTNNNNKFDEGIDNIIKISKSEIKLGLHPLLKTFYVQKNIALKSTAVSGYFGAGELKVTLPDSKLSHVSGSGFVSSSHTSSNYNEAPLSATIKLPVSPSNKKTVTAKTAKCKDSQLYSKYGCLQIDDFDLTKAEYNYLKGSVSVGSVQVEITFDNNPKLKKILTLNSASALEIGTADGRAKVYIKIETTLNQKISLNDICLKLTDNNGTPVSDFSLLIQQRFSDKNVTYPISYDMIGDSRDLNQLQGYTGTANNLKVLANTNGEIHFNYIGLFSELELTVSYSGVNEIGQEISINEVINEFTDKTGIWNLNNYSGNAGDCLQVRLRGSAVSAAKQIFKIEYKDASNGQIIDPKIFNNSGGTIYCMDRSNNLSTCAQLSSPISIAGSDDSKVEYYLSDSTEKPNEILISFNEFERAGEKYLKIYGYDPGEMEDDATIGGKVFKKTVYVAKRSTSFLACRTIENVDFCCPKFEEAEFFTDANIVNITEIARLINALRQSTGSHVLAPIDVLLAHETAGMYAYANSNNLVLSDKLDSKMCISLSIQLISRIGFDSYSIGSVVHEFGHIFDFENDLGKDLGYDEVGPTGISTVRTNLSNVFQSIKGQNCDGKYQSCFTTYGTTADSDELWAEFFELYLLSNGKLQDVIKTGKVDGKDIDLPCLNALKFMYKILQDSFPQLVTFQYDWFGTSSSLIESSKSDQAELLLSRGSDNIAYAQSSASGSNPLENYLKEFGFTKTNRLQIDTVKPLTDAVYSVAQIKNGDFLKSVYDSKSVVGKVVTQATVATNTNISETKAVAKETVSVVQNTINFCVNFVSLLFKNF